MSQLTLKRERLAIKSRKVQKSLTGRRMLLQVLKLFNALVSLPGASAAPTATALPDRLRQ